MRPIDKSYTIDDVVVDELLQDWFNRNADGTFSRVKAYGLLDWQSHLDDGEALSEYFFKAKDFEHLVREIYGQSKDMLTVMLRGDKFKLRLHRPTTSYSTAEKQIVVSTKVLDNPDMTLGEKCDVVLGTGIHEGGHILFTSFDYMPSNKFVKALANILEDERIETEVGNKYPGYIGFLERTKYYYYNVVTRGRREDALPKVARFVNTLNRVIRYPSALTEKEIVEFAYYLKAIKPLLTKIPSSTKECCQVAKEIYETVRELFLKEETERRISEIKESMREEKESRKKSDSSDESSGEDLLDTDGDKSCEGSSKGTHSDEDTSTSEDGTKDEDPGEYGSEYSDTDYDEDTEDSESDISKGTSEEHDEEGAEGESSLDEDFTPEEEDRIRRMAEITAKLSVDRSLEASLAVDTMEKLGDGSFEGSSDKVSSLLADELCGDIEVSSTDKMTIFEKAKGNKDVYERALANVRAFIPSISKVLKGHCRDYQYLHRSMRSGKLDSNKLVEASLGVETVYTKIGEVKTDRICAVLLIDESGSMNGPSIVRAREAAVLLNESLKSIPNVEFYVYGHTADVRSDGFTEITVYREREYAPHYALGSVMNKCENRDGTAILEVAKRVRKFNRTDPMIMFVISDGEPSADSYRGAKAKSHTKRMVEEVEKKYGVVPIQIQVSGFVDTEMFKHSFRIDSIGELPKLLGLHVKQSLQKLAKIQIK